MKLAIIFWFYKEPEICLNRLILIKKHNPDCRIFGLFGGDKNDAEMYQTKLDAYLDDFYVTTMCDKPKDYKWIHGDLMILDWYQNRGAWLDGWDSVAIVQWDALILGKIADQLPGIKKGELFISGTKRLDHFTESQWSWTKPDGDDYDNYIAFKKYIAEEHEYTDQLLCSLFIFSVFPREFFEKWLTIKDKEIGMLEYKLPTYAKIFNIPLYTKNLGVWWFEEKARRGETAMNALEVEISKDYIDSELKKEDGLRIFHPYFKIWDGGE